MNPIRASVAALAALLLGTPAAAQEKPLRLDLNIPAMELVVYEGDQEVNRYRVAVGLPGHDTPTGSFEISRAEWNPWWRPPEREWARGEKITPPGPKNPMGRVKLFFLPYYFIHGTPEKGSIGSAASHGCVRMLNSDVIALARLLHEKARTGVSDRAIDAILNRPGATRVVGFKEKIPLEIRYEPVVVENGTLRVHPDVYGYNRIHHEAVYQALLAAGYDPAGVSRAEIAQVLEKAKGAKKTFSIPLSEAFGGLLAAT